MTEREKKQLSGKELAQEIETVCEGLVYVSETDSPIELIFLAREEGVTFSEAVGNSFQSKQVLKKHPAENFLDRLTAKKEWHGQRELARAKKFSKLRNLLEQNLTEIVLLRAGRIRVEIVVAGTDIEGNIIGFKTQAVET